MYETHFEALSARYEELLLSSHQNGLIQRQPTILNGIMIGTKVAIGSFLINKRLQFPFRNIARENS